ncbi:hypothetical protein U1Q18_003055 [Sarracenia purpurea var. burkii]
MLRRTSASFLILESHLFLEPALAQSSHHPELSHQYCSYWDSPMMKMGSRRSPIEKFETKRAGIQRGEDLRSGSYSDIDFGIGSFALPPIRSFMSRFISGESICGTLVIPWRIMCTSGPKIRLGRFVGIRRPNSKLPIDIDGTKIVILDAIGSTGLELKTDPGVPIVYAGFGALMLTTCISFLSHAQI